MFMKKIIDKNGEIKKIEKENCNDQIKSIRDLVENICLRYEMNNPRVFGSIISYDLADLAIEDSLFGEKKTYILTIPIIDSKEVTVRVLGQLKSDVFLVQKDTEVHYKRIYENFKKGIFLEKINTLDEENFATVKEGGVEYVIYKFRLIKKTLEEEYNVNILFKTLKGDPFVESLFADKLINSNINFSDINSLYATIFHVLNCSDAYLKIVNETTNEMIITKSKDLIEYRKKSYDEEIYYVNGNCYITKILEGENESIKKVLKLVRGEENE